MLLFRLYRENKMLRVALEAAENARVLEATSSSSPEAMRRWMEAAGFAAKMRDEATKWTSLDTD